MQPVQELVKEPQTCVIARFQDCDPFGHLNNARYIDYFLNTRQDQIAEHYQIRTYEPGMQASWVVRTTQIAYVRPVAAMEEVIIRTRLIHFSETALVMEGLMMDREDRHLKALIWVDFVYVGLATGRPVAHPDELMALFGSVAFPDDYHPNGFKHRVELARRRQPGERPSAETQPADS